MIRDRAHIYPRRVVELAYQVHNVRELVDACHEFDSRFATGLRAGYVTDSAALASADRLAREQLMSRDPSVFFDMLGAHVTSMTFEEALAKLPLPINYLGTMGYPVWGNKGLLIASCVQLRGVNVFSS